MALRDLLRDRAETIARFGLMARAVVYAVMGLLALRVATGTPDEEAEGQGAVRLLAEQPLGSALLVVLAMGFAGYALWRLLRALSGAGEGRRREGAGAVVKGAGDVLNGLVYLSLTAATVRLLARDDPGRGSDEQARSWSARLLELGWGRVIVVVAGAACVVAAAGMAWWAVTRRFAEHLRIADMSAGQRRWLPRLGVVGHCSRALVALVIGLFLVQAALDHDPDEAVGIDGALRRLAEQPYGTVALVLVAAGFLAYGAYSVVEARWRKVLEG